MASLLLRAMLLSLLVGSGNVLLSRAIYPSGTTLEEFVLAGTAEAVQFLSSFLRGGREGGSPFAQAQPLTLEQRFFYSGIEMAIWCFGAITTTIVLGEWIASRQPGRDRRDATRYAAIHVTVVVSACWTLFAAMHLLGFDANTEGRTLLLGTVTSVLRYGTAAMLPVYPTLVQWYSIRLKSCGQDPISYVASLNGLERLLTPLVFWVLCIDGPLDARQAVVSRREKRIQQVRERGQASDRDAQTGRRRIR